MARGLKFRIKEVEELYYPCSENKGADQLRGYGEAILIDRTTYDFMEKLPSGAGGGGYFLYK